MSIYNTTTLKFDYDDQVFMNKCWTPTKVGKEKDSKSKYQIMKKKKTYFVEKYKFHIN